MSKELSLAVTPSIKLRTSQASLYKFIKEAYDSEKTITLNDVIIEYSKYGVNKHLFGKPAYYHYDWSNHTQFLKVMDDDMLRIYAIQWFIRNLGIFVVKGLLTAIPTMNLNQLEVVNE